MAAFSEFAENFSKRGGHECFFCSAVQFASLWRFFQARTEEVVENAVKTKVFDTKLAPSFYTREHGNYL